MIGKDDEGRIVVRGPTGTVLTLNSGGRRWAYVHVHAPAQGGLGYISGPETLRAFAKAILREIPPKKDGAR